MSHQDQDPSVRPDREGRSAATPGADSPDAVAALAAVDRIIADFGANRVDAYFAGFAPEATFLFHAEAARLESRDDYRRLWDTWIAESGFEVRGCRSTNRRIQLLGDVAVFTHDVDTTVWADGALADSQERETIVMQRRDGGWLCVHEHLSTMPRRAGSPGSAD